MFFLLGLFAKTPPLNYFVNDHAHVLSSDVAQNLEAQLTEIDEKESTQIIVLTIDKLENETMENFSYRIFNHYKIGQKDKDNGVLICLSKEDREIRIEVGKGLEGKLVDLIAGHIIRERMAPYLKDNNYDKGIEEGVNAVIEVVRGEFQTTEKDGKKSAFIFVIIFLLIWILMFFRSRSPYSSRGRGGPFIWVGNYHGSSFSSGGFSSGGFSGGGGGSSGGGASGKF
jgi:uncharacterized protein